MPYTTAFKKLMKSTRKTYLHKGVPKKYQNKYGKRYDEDETKSVAFATAKVKGVKIE